MAGPIRCSSLTLTHEDYKKHETNIFTEHVPLEINHTFRKTKTVSVFRYRRSSLDSGSKFYLLSCRVNRAPGAAAGKQTPSKHRSVERVVSVFSLDTCSSSRP